MSRPSAAVRIAVLSLLMGGCSKAPDSTAEGIETSEVLHSLLEEPGWRTVVRQHPEHPVRVDVLRTRRQTSGEGLLGAHPAIEMTPDCEVRFALPETPEDAYLQFGLGIVARNYRAEGEVRFEFLLDGDPVLARAIPSSQTVDREERQWHPFRFPLEGARELIVRTSYSGSHDEPTRCAVADLTIETPRFIERAQASPEHPNVVLVVIDTLRADRLSTYGNPLHVSPIIDQLGERGTVFERAYTPAPWTVPSTAAILSSESPIGQTLGAVQSSYQPYAKDMLAEAFQDAGFTTGGFSCNTLVSASRNFDQGFQTFHGYRWKRSAEILDDVLGWIDAHHGERFFLYLHTVDPHDPYEPLDDFRLPGPTRPEGFTENTVKLLMDRFDNETGFPADFLRAVVRYNFPLYDAELAGNDFMIGQVLDRLREYGLEENTIVAVTSDHGEEFGEHGMMGHANQLFEESHHVPLVLAGPGVPRGERIEVRVENRFVGPTLLSLAGVPGRAGLTGPDLLDPEQREVHTHEPFFRANGDGWIFDSAARVWRRAKRMHGLLDDRWFLVSGLTGADQDVELVNLFDLQQDPDTKHDVAGEHPDVVERLVERLNAFVRERREHGREAVMEGADDRRVMEALGYVGDD